jgi:hypothetical protein
MFQLCKIVEGREVVINTFKYRKFAENIPKRYPDKQFYIKEI